MCLCVREREGGRRVSVVKTVNVPGVLRYYTDAQPCKQA